MALQYSASMFLKLFMQLFEDERNQKVATVTADSSQI